jgi:hypothetical protein
MTAAATKTKTQVLNLVLSELKCNLITDPDELSPEAEQVNIHYEQVYSEMLENNYWSFAQFRAELAALSDAPAFEYAYAFAKPEKCLKIKSVWSSLNSPIPYVLEGDNILANYSPIRVKYTKLVDEGACSSQFIRALVTEIVARVTFATTGSGTQKEANKQSAIAALIEARSADAMQMDTEVPEDSDLLMVRDD